jgi:hypothetical protein
VEITRIKPEKIVAACPKYVAGRIDNGALAGIIWADKYIQAGLQADIQRRIGCKATKTGSEYLG